MDKEEYRKLERETKGMIRRRKKGLEKEIARDAKRNPKAYYSYINSGKKMRSKVGPLKVVGDDGLEIVVEPKRQAEILNQFYASVFSRSQGAVSTKERPTDVPVIEKACMDVERVKSAIRRLKESSAPGPDAIPNKLIIETAEVISEPLSILF